MQRKDRFGFTLIELLIVIAVIAVIAAILFPVFAQAREKARAAACFSNLHQISLASEIYTQDYDETFLWNPLFGGARGKDTAALILRATGQQRDCVDQPVAGWTVLLQPYVKSEGVFRCPSFAGLPANLSPTRFPGLGYGVNNWVIGDPCQPHTVASLRHSPSEVALAQSGWRRSI